MHQTPGYPVSENINNWKTQINTNPSIVGDFSIPLFPMYRLPGQTKNRKTSKLIAFTHQKNLTDIYSIFCPNTKEFTFSPAVHGHFQKADHIL